MTSRSTDAGRLDIDPDLRDAAGAATRALLDGGPKLIMWWWVMLAAAFIVAAIARDIFGTVESSTWQWAATAPKVMMLFAGGMLSIGFLPQYISFGISRRAFSLAAGVVIIVLSLAGSAIMSGGFIVEILAYDALGWRHVFDEPLLFASTGQWYLIVPELTLLFMAWSASGWIAAAGFYRWVGFGGWDWLAGTLFLIPASMPLIAAEAIKSWTSQGRVPLLLGLVGILLAVAAGAVAAYHITKDMSLRHSDGWAA